MQRVIHTMTNRNTALSTHTHVLADGRTLAYTSSGAIDGFPVVVHHGTPGSRLFAALLSDPATEEGVRLIVPDRPGYGRSSPPPPGWTWREWRNDLTELLRAESIDRAALMGFSGGGPFALAAANSDWASRLGLISTVVPPADTGLARLSKIPFAVRLLFRLSNGLAAVTGPGTIVKQYTDRSVSEQVSQAVAKDFHEALRQGAKAVARENSHFGTGSLEVNRLSIPIQAWHGARDENTPLSPVRTLINDTDGTLITTEADHLGTVLDFRRDVLRWLGTDSIDR